MQGLTEMCKILGYLEEFLFEICVEELKVFICLFWLKGKKAMLAITTGGPESEFITHDDHKADVNAWLWPLQVSSNFKIKLN